MPSGGARARNGSTPDPGALRRERDAGEWVSLPAEGREGPPPKWPLSKCTARERVVWARFWVLPQAVMWERQGQEFEVGLFVRRLVEAEAPGSPVAVSTLCRQMFDSLGLSVPGMRANRWKLGDKPVAEAREVVPVAALTRDRFRVVGT